MTDKPKIYLDTNVFINTREHFDERSTLLTNLLFSGLIFVTSTITLAELVVKPHALGQEKYLEWYKRNIVSSDWLEVVPVEHEIAYYAGVLKSNRKSLKLPDALHLSTAIAMQCTHFLTDDGGIKGPVSIEHTRYGILRISHPLEVIRPDIPTLESLLQSVAP